MFAADCNAKLQRYCARYSEPGAEAVNALALEDWVASLCQGCRQWHAEVPYLFPPMGLEKAALAKAQADGLRTIVVVPLAVQAPHWAQLRRCAVAGGPPGGFVRLAGTGRWVERLGGRRVSDWAVFACDFGRPGVAAARRVVPACAGAGERRPRLGVGTLAERQDRDIVRRRLEHFLLRQGRGN